MKFPSYTTRNEVQSPLTVWTLYPDHIAIQSHYGPAEEQSPVEKIRFHEVDRVELRIHPTRRLFSCLLLMKDGREREFFNRTWSDDEKPLFQSREYVLFVPNVLKALGRDAPDCRFNSGINSFRYFQRLYFTNVALAGALGVIGFFALAGVIWVAIALFGFTLLFVPRTFKWFRIHRPDEFSPSNIPARLLPKF